MAAQGLHVHDVVLHRPGKGQVHADGLVIKLGPQDARGVQQVQGLVHIYPLLAPGDTGPVPRLGGLLPGYLVDEGGLAHVGHPHHHGPHRTAHLALLPPFGDLILQHVLNHGGKLVHAASRFGVRLQHSVALTAEKGGPLFVPGGVGLVGPVEDDEPGLAGADAVDVRVPAGHGDAGIDDLHHDIHVFQVRLDLPAGLGHVSGVPLNVQGSSSSLLPRCGGWSNIEEGSG